MLPICYPLDFFVLICNNELDIWIISIRKASRQSKPMPLTKLHEPERPTVVSCKMPAEIVEVIDAIVRPRATMRSTWLREAIFEKLARDKIVTPRHDQFGLAEVMG